MPCLLIRHYPLGKSAFANSPLAWIQTCPITPARDEQIRKPNKRSIHAGDILGDTIALDADCSDFKCSQELPGDTYEAIGSEAHVIRKIIKEQQHYLPIKMMKYLCKLSKYLSSFDLSGRLLLAKMPSIPHSTLASEIDHIFLITLQIALSRLS